MIGHVIKNNIDPILSGFAWIQHYGGYTIPVQIDTTGPDGSAVVNTFPFSPDYALVECQENDQYLVPNQNKISIGYWEELGQMSTVDSQLVPTGKMFSHFQQSIRLVIWYNAARAGYSSHVGLKSSMMVSILRELGDHQSRNIENSVLPLIYFKINSIAGSESKGLTIFSKYSYFPVYRELFKPPYDFFAIDFNAEWIIKNDCIPAVTLNDSLEC